MKEVVIKVRLGENYAYDVSGAELTRVERLMLAMILEELSRRLKECEASIS